MCGLDSTSVIRRAILDRGGLGRLREGAQKEEALALQLPFCFEVRALGDGLVSSAPEGPCDGVCRLNPLSIKSDGNAANFLE